MVDRPLRMAEPAYPSDMKVRKVRSTGEIKLAGSIIQISSALTGEAVAVEEIERGWRVWFYQEPIGLIDHRGQKLLPIQPG